MRRLHTYASRSSFGSDKAILPIQHLHLINTSQLSSTDIYRIFQSCQTLREIKVNHNPDLTEGEYETTYECLEHLQHCRNNLEILDWPYEMHFRRILIELAFFTRLRSVTVVVCSLFNDGDIAGNDEEDEEKEETNSKRYIVTKGDLVDCFPVSIEHITFYLCYRYADDLHPFTFHDPAKHVNEDALMAFAGAAAVRLPNLNKVTYRYGQVGIEDEWLTKLVEEFSAIGVQFSVEEGYF
jgi:hypothetical protein